jgi:hypothetical protein
VYEFPLVAMAAACGIDLKALTGGIWVDLFNTWIVFAQQYAQLTQRWYSPPQGYAYAECNIRRADTYIWSDRRAGDYSIMQPAVQVNTTILVYIVLVAMQTNIGRKEQVIYMYLLAVCLFATCCSAHTDALADGTGAAGYEQRQRKCRTDRGI